MQAVAPNTSASGLEPRPSDALKATEAACSALGNLVYRHSDNQRAALDSGVANLCLQLLRTPDACAHVAATAGTTHESVSNDYGGDHDRYGRVGGNGGNNNVTGPNSNKTNL